MKRVRRLGMPFLTVWTALTLLIAAMSGVSGKANDPTPPAYQVTSTQEFDLLAGPVKTAAHLSPDGRRFVQLWNPEVCLYQLSDDGTWGQPGCAQPGVEVSQLAQPEEMRWSPDGRYLTMPTFQNAMQFFRDTDIAIIDADTGVVTNLTDDRVDGSFTRSSYKGMLDISPVWVDADRILFLRYRPVSQDSTIPFDTPDLMVVHVSDGSLETIAELPAPNPAAVYTLAVSPDGGFAAYNVDSAGDDPQQGIWQVNLSDGSLKQLVHLQRSEMPAGLAYSADGEYLLLVRPVEDTLDMGLRILDVATGEMKDAAPDQTVMGAGWSPTGAALAYIVHDLIHPDQSGLYIADTPGAAGRLVLPGEFYPPTCCGRMPLVWATNDIILIGRGGTRGVLAVQMGE